MSEFKVGDAVEITHDEFKGYKARLLVEDPGFNARWCVRIAGVEVGIYLNESELKKIPITLDNLMVGDILLYNEGGLSRVLSVCGEIVHISRRGEIGSDTHRIDGAYFSVFRLEQSYKLHNPKEKELTEYNGKKYNKKEFDKRIEKLEEAK